MRADRLISLLMLLQARGKMTAGELAKELEVSERTIYRDIDALGTAGAPVYGEPGRTGGYALLDSYRTTLTGLTTGEARALFMLSIPAPLAELGVGPELKAALLKMSAAMPASQRETERHMRQRFHLDAAWWRQARRPAPFLTTIHQAVLQDLMLQVVYSPMHNVQIERLAAPYGLVAKAGVWYLVYASRGAVRARLVSEFMKVRLTQERFKRPNNFDLQAFWEKWSSQHEADLADFLAHVRVSARLLPLLPYYFGDPIKRQIEQSGPPDKAGWLELDLSFESFEDARSRLLGFGGGVEVLAPPALRRSVQDYAQQAAALYSLG